MFEAPSGKTNSRWREPACIAHLSTSFVSRGLQCEALSTGFPRSSRDAGPSPAGQAPAKRTQSAGRDGHRSITVGMSGLTSSDDGAWADAPTAITPGDQRRRPRCAQGAGAGTPDTTKRPKEPPVRSLRRLCKHLRRHFQSVAPSGKTNNTGRVGACLVHLSTTFAESRPDSRWLSTVHPRTR